VSGLPPRPVFSTFDTLSLHDAVLPVTSRTRLKTGRVDWTLRESDTPRRIVSDPISTPTTSFPQSNSRSTAPTTSPEKNIIDGTVMHVYDKDTLQKIYHTSGRWPYTRRRFDGAGSRRSVCVQTTSVGSKRHDESRWILQVHFLQCIDRFPTHGTLAPASGTA
jgi:hypothetical protein